MSVARGLGTKLRKLTAVLTITFSATSCTAGGCLPVTRAAEPQVAVEVVHVEGSDGPTTWTLVVYTEGILELTKLGKKSLCRKISSRELETSNQLIEGNQYQDAAEYDGFLGHEEWMQVTVQGTTRRFVADNLASGVRPVFEELDRLFTKEFGRRYGWLLIDSASGPKPQAGSGRYIKRQKP